MRRFEWNNRSPQKQKPHIFTPWVLSILPAIFHLQSLRSFSFLGSPTSVTNSYNPRRERSAHVNKPFSAGQAVRTWQQLELLLTYFMVKRWIHVDPKPQEKPGFGSRRCSNLRELDAANRLMSAALNLQIQRSGNAEAQFVRQFKILKQRNLGQKTRPSDPFSLFCLFCPCTHDSPVPALTMP